MIPPPPTCSKCGAEQVLVLSLPASWEGTICVDCALGDPETAAAFRAWFGEKIHFVSDGDAGHGEPKT